MKMVSSTLCGFDEGSRPIPWWQGSSASNRNFIAQRDLKHFVFSLVLIIFSSLRVLRCSAFCLTFRSRGQLLN
jgi:hypothetical protein